MPIVRANRSCRSSVQGRPFRFVIRDIYLNNHELFLSVYLLTGLGLGFAKYYLIEKVKGAPIILTLDKLIYIRKKKVRSLQRSLKIFQLDTGAKAVRRNGRNPSWYNLVPRTFTFKFRNIVELSDGSTAQLPLFTEDHFKT